MPNTGFINACFIIDIDTFVKFNDTSADEPTLTISEDLVAFFKENQDHVKIKILMQKERTRCEKDKIYLYKINEGFEEEFHIKFPFKVTEENLIFFKEDSERLSKIIQQSQDSSLQPDQIVIVSPDPTLLQKCSQFSVIYPSKEGDLAVDDLEELIERLTADENRKKHFKLDIDGTLLLHEQSQIAGKPVINGQIVDIFNSNQQKLKNSFYTPLTTRLDPFDATTKLIPELKPYLSEDIFHKLKSLEITYTLNCLKEIKELLKQARDSLLGTKIIKGTDKATTCERLKNLVGGMDHPWGSLLDVIEIFQKQTGLSLELSPECFMEFFHDKKNKNAPIPDKSVPIQADLHKYPSALHVFFDNTHRHLQAARKLPPENLCIVKSLEKNEFASKARETYAQLQKKYPLPQSLEEEYPGTDVDIVKSDSEPKEDSEYSYDENVESSDNFESEEGSESEDFEIDDERAKLSEEINSLNDKLNENKIHIINLCNYLIKYTNNGAVTAQLFKNKKTIQETISVNLKHFKNQFEKSTFTIDETICLKHINNCLFQLPSLNKTPIDQTSQDTLNTFTEALSKLNNGLSSYVELLSRYSQAHSQFLKCSRQETATEESTPESKKSKSKNVNFAALKESMSEMFADVADAKQEDSSENESAPENELPEGVQSKMQGDFQ